MSHTVSQLGGSVWSLALRWRALPVVLLGVAAWACATIGVLGAFLLPLTAGLAGVLVGRRGSLAASAFAGLAVFLIKWLLLLGPLLALIALFPSPDWAGTLEVLPSLARLALIEVLAAAVVGLLGGILARRLGPLRA